MTAGEGVRPEEELERLLAEQQHRGPRAFEAGDVTPLAETAGRLMRAGRAIPPGEREEQALRNLIAELEEARTQPEARGVRVVAAALFARPMMRSAVAAAAAIVVVGGAGLGAAAATGSGQPVREFLRISTDSAIKVEFTGVVLSANGNQVQVDANGDIRTVVLGANTQVMRAGTAAAPTDLVVGQVVEVHGRLRADNNIDATRVTIEDPIASPTAGAPTAEPSIDVPGFVPGDADDGDDHGDDGAEPGDDHGDDGNGAGDDHGDDEDEPGDDHGVDSGDGDEDSTPATGGGVSDDADGGEHESNTTPEEHGDDDDADHEDEPEDKKDDHSDSEDDEPDESDSGGEDGGFSEH